jgi:small multidrug resistance pump
MKYIFLLLAVIAETIGTTALQASKQFSVFWPSVIVVIAYAAAFYMLALTLRYFPVGIAYALWSALGILLITGIAYLVYDQKLDLPALIGLAFIIIGIIIIQVFSKTATH